MKIAIFSDVFFPKIDGVVSSVFNLVKGLADKGHKVFLIVPKVKNYKKEFFYKNIKIIKISSIPAFFYPGFRFTNLVDVELFKLLKKENIDIIHFHTPLTLGFQAIIIAKLLKKPVVGTFHTFLGDTEILKNAGFDYKCVGKIMNLFSKAYYDRCDLITCPSEETKKLLLTINIKKPIKVISNSIDFKIFDNLKTKEIKEKYNKNGDLILFIGRIAYEKNIFYLLECMKPVFDEIPSAKLLIIGDGPQKKGVKKKISELGIEKNVVMTGGIPYEELIKSSIYPACKVFVSASIVETQSTTVIESQINGLPCVVINGRGMKNLIKNNYNGFIVENGDKKKFAESVINILKNKILYEKLKKNSLKDSKKYELSNITKIWEKEYEKVINSFSA